MVAINIILEGVFIFNLSLKLYRTTSLVRVTHTKSNVSRETLLKKFYFPGNIIDYLNSYFQKVYHYLLILHFQFY